MGRGRLEASGSNGTASPFASGLPAGEQWSALGQSASALLVVAGPLRDPLDQRIEQALLEE